MVAEDPAIGRDTDFNCDRRQAGASAELAALAITVVRNQSAAIVNSVICRNLTTLVLMFVVTNVLGGLRRAAFVPAVGRRSTPDELEGQQAQQQQNHERARHGGRFYGTR